MNLRGGRVALSFCLPNYSRVITRLGVGLAALHHSPGAAGPIALGITLLVVLVVLFIGDRHPPKGSA